MDGITESKSKLETFPSAPGTLYNDDDLRLDLQGGP